MVRATNLSLERASYGEFSGWVGGIGCAFLSRGQLAIRTVSGVCVCVCVCVNVGACAHQRPSNCFWISSALGVVDKGF